MPINYKEYPANWFAEIRPNVLRRAGEIRDDAGNITTEARCEECGVTNHDMGYRDAAGTFIPWKEIEEALERRGYDYFDKELKHCINRVTGKVKRALKIG